MRKCICIVISAYAKTVYKYIHTYFNTLLYYIIQFQKQTNKQTKHKKIKIYVNLICI